MVWTIDMLKNLTHHTFSHSGFGCPGFFIFFYVFYSSLSAPWKAMGPSNRKMVDVRQWKTTKNKHEHRGRCKKHYKKIKTSEHSNLGCEQLLCRKTWHIIILLTLDLDTLIFLYFYNVFFAPHQLSSEVLGSSNGKWWVSADWKRWRKYRNIWGGVQNIIKK